MKIFRRIAADIVCLWSSKFGKRARQLILYFLDPFLRSKTNTILIVIIITLSFVLAHDSRIANKTLLRNYPCNSILIVYLQPESYKSKVRTKKVTY